jgi:hypothetical protein
MIIDSISLVKNTEFAEMIKDDTLYIVFNI